MVVVRTFAQRPSHVENAATHLLRNLMWFRAISLCAALPLLLGLVGCSSNGSSTTTTTGGITSVKKLPCLTGTGAGLDCQAKLEVHQSDSGKLLIQGSTVDVPVAALQSGQIAKMDFSLLNVTSVATASPLRIDAIELKYTRPTAATDTDGDPAFACWDATGTQPCKTGATYRTFHQIVPAGQADTAKGWVSEEKFRITYKQFDSTARVAQVCVHASGDPAVADKPICFSLVTKLGKPKIDVKTGLQFEYVATGDSKDQALTVTNAGDVTLCLTAMQFDGDPSFTIQDPAGTKHKVGDNSTFAPQICLDSGKSKDFTVTFKPTDEKQKQANLHINSNDPSKPTTLTILLGNSKVPCLHFVDSDENAVSEYNLGSATIGQTSIKSMRLCACGSQDITVTDLSFAQGSSDNFLMDLGTDPTPSASVPLVIKVNTCYDFHGKYTPNQVNPVDSSTGQQTPDVANLQATSNASPQSVKLTGVGVKQNCPQAVISVTDGAGNPLEEAIPQTVLSLSGTQSISPGGNTIAKYQWSIKKKPAGSVDNFVPSPTFPTPKFTVNVAGEYVFCLDVTDSAGGTTTPECGQACTSIFVTPKDALHLELLWDTPGDKDQTDAGPGAGADMDLHFASQLAVTTSSLDIDCDGTNDPWFASNFDCFWFDAKPTWGVLSTTDDDPSLDLDDTDGAGPENINMVTPSGTQDAPQKYYIGAHYWNDHGFGTSFATVNVYILGNLFATYKSPEMKTLDFWTVGILNWPNTSAGAGKLDPVTQCYQSGNACIGKSDPSNPKGGSMWQKSGDACIAHCYISPLAPSGVTSCPQ